MEKEKPVFLKFQTNVDFKTKFQRVAKEDNFKTDSHCLSVLAKDYVSKRLGPQEIMNQKLAEQEKKHQAELVEAEKKAHIGAFGEVKYDEQGNVKNLFKIMNNQ